jgi:FkbM family methyltransferase
MLKKMLKSFFIEMIPMRVKKMIASEVLGNEDFNLDNIYFSQEGEDIILSKLFFDKKDGFYVDIGAHHPVKLSNTYKYYLQGWAGINIDALPGSMQLFHQKRSRDINIEIGIASEEKVMPFYVFDQAALNTFDESTAHQHVRQNGASIINTLLVKTAPLVKVLDAYLPKGKQIDFMSIDVEGFDLIVLQTNDWSKYRPTVILVESIGTDFELLLHSEMHTFLNEKGYTIMSKTFHTVFYKCKV